MGKTSVVVCGHIFRVEADGLVEIPDCSVELAQINVGNAPVVVCGYIFLVKSDGLVKVWMACLN